MTARTRPPRTHLVTAHPDPGSLTVAVHARIAAHLRAAGATVTTDNLATSGFHAAYTPVDQAGYRGFYARDPQPPAPDVADQHQLLEASDALVLVFPVHWWSMPAQMKGWLDRVLTGAWLWRHGGSERRTSLSGLVVHLVPLTGSSQDSYERHGYRSSMVTQIQHGIFEYTHTGAVRWHWMWDAADHPQATLDATLDVAQEVLATAPAHTG